jgi:hypothetical protein
MLGRLFGRSKEDNDDTVCSVCGRTLLAGEWTQRLVDDDGSERYVCSLCARPADASDAVEAPPVEGATGTNDDRVKSAKADSDVFWRALKDKDVEISRLESLLARSEAEKQELAAELARLRGEREPASVANEPERRDDAGADTMAIPPSELPDAEPVDVAPPELPALEPDAGPAPIERTDPHLGEVLRGVAAAAGQSGDAESGATAADSGATAADGGAMPPFEPAPELEAADDLIPLTILQRGVDLLNVSAVPKRIVETNESLGMPQVHVGSQGEATLLVTFMWTMGWYQFRVELADGGRITLADRGYEERTDVRPNASVRSDGTVQLAATQMKPATPKDNSDVKPAGVTSGVIISKSLMGQRTDDENVPTDWKTQRAPDFDWGR